MLDDIDPDAPARLFPDVRSLWGKAWEITIEKVTMVVEPSEDLPSERVVMRDNIVFFDDGGNGRRC